MLAANSARAFARRFGFAPPAEASRMVATLRVEAVVAGERRRDRRGRSAATRAAAAAARAPGSTAGAEVPLLQRAALAPGEPVAGPALIVEPNSTTVVEPGWSAERLADGMLRLARRHAAAAAAIDAGRADPAQLELFNHRFMQVAEQMGAVLQATAVSVNIRERLDFSCALFDAAGSADRECAAHAGAPRFHGRERARGHRGERGRDSVPVAPGC